MFVPLGGNNFNGTVNSLALIAKISWIRSHFQPYHSNTSSFSYECPKPTPGGYVSPLPQAVTSIQKIIRISHLLKHRFSQQTKYPKEPPCCKNLSSLGNFTTWWVLQPFLDMLFCLITHSRESVVENIEMLLPWFREGRKRKSRREAEKEEERSWVMFLLEWEAPRFSFFVRFCSIGNQAWCRGESRPEMVCVIGERRGERFIRSRLDTALQFRSRNCENRRA